MRVRLTLAGATIQQSPEEFDFEVCTEVAAESGSPRCFRLPEVEDPSHRRFETSYLPSFSGTYTIRMQQLPAVEDYFAVVGVGVE